MEALTESATLKDIGAFMLAFNKAVGPKCDVYASVNADGTCVFSAYLGGLTRSEEGVLRTDNKATWAEASTDLLEKWEAQRANHRSVKLRKMALEIIQITADQGECTDRALRLSFSQSEIDTLGADAIALATEMAANGPFSIVATAQANAA